MLPAPAALATVAVGAVAPQAADQRAGPSESHDDDEYQAEIEYEQGDRTHAPNVALARRGWRFYAERAWAAVSASSASIDGVAPSRT